MNTDQLLLSLIRPYEQSGRILYRQMQVELPRWRSFFYSYDHHLTLLAHLEHQGRIISRLSQHRDQVRWYRST